MEKTLITPLFGMGDTLLTTPALQLLKENKGDCEITFFTFSNATYEIMLNNPNIDHLWYYPIKAIHFLKGIYHILSSFSFRYDTCINFYPSNRAAYNLFSLLTVAKKRIGHTYLNMNLSQLNWLKNKTIPEDYNTHCVEENIRLLNFFGINPDPQKIPATRIYLSDDELAGGQSFKESIAHKPIVGIHTGTSTFKGQAKRRWSKEHFVRLIDLLPDIHFLLFGAFDEIEVNRYIQSSVKKSNLVSIIENKSIREVAAIIGELDAFISNDSGLMHIAAAMNTAVVAILGPTNPNYIHPWDVKHKVVRLDLPCSPCFYYSPRPLCCRLNNSFKCMTELESSQVAKALKELLDIN